MLATAALLLAAAGLAASAGDDGCANTLSVDYPAPVAAGGWSYRLVAGGLTKPRGILFDRDGGLLVVDAGVGLVHLALKDDGGTCLSVDKKTTLLENEDLNHGLALSDDGRTLYASSSDSVFSWAYDSAGPSLSDANRTVVANMSNSDHTTRTLLLSRARPGVLVVSRGSDSNQDPDAEDLDSGHSQIRAFDLDGLDNDAEEGGDPYDFLDGAVLGWGLRNSVGVAEEPSSGGLWSVENSVDELTRDGTDVHQNNPAEELNFHGHLNASTFSPSSSSGDSSSQGSDAEQGGNYGYPLCYAVWSTDDGFPDPQGLAVGDQFPGAETQALSDESCGDDYVAPRLVFQAHTAPLDIKFADDASEAFISFHGSWNRDDPVGYRIARVDFSGGEPTASRTSKDAAADVLTNPDLSNCPDDCFRPAGLAWDARRRLWFSSDSTGEVFVLERGSGEGGGGGDGDDEAQDDAGAQLMPGRSAAWALALGAVVLGVLLV